VATSSAGVAAALGLPDNDSSPPGPVFDLLGRIAAAVDVPVTADVSGGYGLPPAELVDRLLSAGLVGCNLEDSDHARPGALLEPKVVARRIAGVREASAAAGVHLVVNARVDTVLRHDGPPAEVLPETLRRARLYLDAGADCVYPISLGDPAVLSTLVAELAAPVNGNPGAMSVGDLTAAGVSRVSTGARGQRLAQAEFRRFADSLLGRPPA
jgi:2-methylisocitrate lyase-like PEP mutase family enzyme